MRMVLERKLEEVRKEEEEILEKIDERNKRKKIDCKSCDESHQIQSLVLIQTYWKTPPRGCIGGDYLNEGEIQFVCPETKVINRMLFDNSDVPWEERREYENNPKSQFKRNYSSLFKEVIEGYETGYKSRDGRDLEDGEITNGRWVNNYYVDQNRKKFGLVEKRRT